jgi:hypothetical protein
MRVTLLALYQSLKVCKKKKKKKKSKLTKLFNVCDVMPAVHCWQCTFLSFDLLLDFVQKTALIRSEQSTHFLKSNREI